MEEKPQKKNDPPHWLQVGDENWGPTDLHKQKARPLPQPLRLPSLPVAPRRFRRLAFTSAPQPLSWRDLGYAAVAIVVLAPSVGFGVWLERLAGGNAPPVLLAGCMAGIFAEF